MANKQPTRNDHYPLGRQLTKDNYNALRKLAETLSYLDFKEATGFGQGIFTRLRRFPTFEENKQYIAGNREKYGVKKPEGKITLRSVYQKLLEIEEKLS